MNWIKVIDREPNYNRYYLIGWYNKDNIFVSFVAFRTAEGWFTRTYDKIDNPDYYCNIINP